MNKVPLVFISTDVITDWPKWRNHARDLAMDGIGHKGEPCVHVNLSSMYATGFDWMDNYQKILDYLWNSPTSLFICVNEKGEETARWYVGSKISDMEQARRLVNPWKLPPPEKVNPAPLWWEIERAQEQEKREALITLRRELRRLLTR